MQLFSVGLQRDPLRQELHGSKSVFSGGCTVAQCLNKINDLWISSKVSSYMAMSDAEAKGQHTQDVKDDPMLNIIPDVCKWKHFSYSSCTIWHPLHTGECKWKQWQHIVCVLTLGLWCSTWYLEDDILYSRTGVNGSEGGASSWLWCHDYLKPTGCAKPLHNTGD